MRIYLGSDHAGFDLKNAIAAHLKKAGHEVIDCGAHEYDALDDYPAFCVSCAEHVRDDEGSLGMCSVALEMASKWPLIRSKVFAVPSSGM